MSCFPPTGVFCWNELLTRDVDAAKAHYAAVFGWTYEPGPEGPCYWVAHLGTTPVAGLFQMEGEAFEGIPPHWFSYIATDALEATVATLEANGGIVLRPPFQVGPFRIALMKDVTGAAIGLTQLVSEGDAAGEPG